MSLFKRIRVDHPLYDVLMEELQRFDSGDHGERYVHGLLQEEFGEAFQHFTKFRLGNYEMDLISVTDRAVFLFEVKNIRGHVHIKNHPAQLIRKTEDGKIDTFKSPMSQLEMNVIKLRQFLQHHSIEVPIYAAVVFAFNNANIHADPHKYPIYIGRDVVRFVLESHPPQAPAHHKLIQLLSAQQERQRYLPKLAKYNLDLHDFRTGVFCPKCDFLPMTRHKYTWTCPSCQHQDRSAHLAALHDYYELKSNMMTNEQCRKFLHLTNRHEAKRILQKNSVTKIGTGRATKYIIKY